MDYSAKDVMKMTVSINYKYWISSSVHVTTKPAATTNGLFGNFFTDGQQIPNTYFTDFPNFQSGFNSFENSRNSLYSSETASVGQGSILI